MLGISTYIGNIPLRLECLIINNSYCKHHHICVRNIFYKKNWHLDISKEYFHFVSEYSPLKCNIYWFKRWIHTSALIQSLFTQPPITLLDITSKLIIQQLCKFHIISIWPQRKKRTTLLLFCGFKQFDISLGTAGVGGWYYW